MKKSDKGKFTTRALMVLATAMADQDYKTAEVIVAALAKEHGFRIASHGQTPALGAREALGCHSSLHALDISAADI